MIRLQCATVRRTVVKKTQLLTLETLLYTFEVAKWGCSHLLLQSL